MHSRLPAIKPSPPPPHPPFPRVRVVVRVEFQRNLSNPIDRSIDRPPFVSSSSLDRAIYNLSRLFPHCDFNHSYYYYLSPSLPPSLPSSRINFRKRERERRREERVTRFRSSQFLSSTRVLQPPRLNAIIIRRNNFVWTASKKFESRTKKKGRSFRNRSKGYPMDNKQHSAELAGIERASHRNATEARVGNARKLLRLPHSKHSAQFKDWPRKGRRRRGRERSASV